MSQVAVERSDGKARLLKMEDGRSVGGNGAVLVVVKEGWLHDVVLRHEYYPHTSDWMVASKHLDNTVFGHGAFSDDGTGGKRETERDTEHDVISVGQIPREVGIGTRIRAVCFPEEVADGDAREKVMVGTA